MNLRDAANRVAVDFIASTHRHFTELDITIARNTILDLIGESPEPDFTNKILREKLLRGRAKLVVKKMEPHLLDLVGLTMEKARS